MHTEPPAAALMSGEFLVMAGEGQASASRKRTLAGANRLAQTRAYAARRHVQCHRRRSRLGLDYRSQRTLDFREATVLLAELADKSTAKVA